MIQKRDVEKNESAYHTVLFMSDMFLNLKISIFVGGGDRLKLSRAGGGRNGECDIT